MMLRLVLSLAAAAITTLAVAWFVAGRVGCGSGTVVLRTPWYLVPFPETSWSVWEERGPGWRWVQVSEVSKQWRNAADAKERLPSAIPTWAHLPPANTINLHYGTKAYGWPFMAMKATVVEGGGSYQLIDAWEPSRPSYTAYPLAPMTSGFVANTLVYWPLWFGILAMASWSMKRVRYRLRRWINPERCASCGYDTHDIDGACPECGHQTRPAAKANTRTSS